MLETIMKMLADQVLHERPALERPITHMKYGLLGALGAGLVLVAAAAVMGAAFYFWLLSSGLSMISALMVVGITLLLAAICIWLWCNRLLEREIRRQELETRRKAEANAGTFTSMVAETVQGVTAGFLEGIRESWDPDKNQARPSEQGTPPAPADKPHPYLSPDGPANGSQRKPH